MRNYYECDEAIKIPHKYQKWSDKKIDRVIKRREFFARVKNRFIPSENKLEKLGYKVDL
ncbi:MAG: hypothetical protein J6A73_00215 [Lachnospiraceae bacterium]|nr:hypothetical protein [Lachnospiraceae bacterium]